MGFCLPRSLVISPSVPSISAVVGAEDCEGPTHWITNEHSVGAAGNWNEHSIIAVGGLIESFSLVKLDCVPEAFFVWVGEEELPGVAAVGGFVEAGEVAFARGH